MDTKQPGSQSQKKKRAKKPKCAMRRFYLKRIEDVSGVSGEGYIAEGVEFTNGEFALHWTSQYDFVTTGRSLKALSEVHGHEGRTVIEYYDE